ncbi:5'-methylthioadenosine/S-adenosylhomocysteine nucleosidase [Lederbergia lenta]|uniref:5'-methylthioadenosine/S-adenosylhomocysteine nucleosidase n=1 Tax=Lederbergia lenta TaxID=1467 RepID=UPI00203DF8E1|nr:5'-methylthioadenosine/S-adenosylhomocysteine nucleosidase [Lederbergia lenta]MCM3112861.1 5'-methylthioadenosine/S-adenosylhomocysteine nucleosidase [Lederbergia lenta]
MNNYFKLFTNIVILLLLLVGCSTNAEKSPETDQQPKKEQPIAVQGAMDVEVSEFLKAMGDYKEEKHGNYSFYVGELEGIPIVVSRTEVGMVNAAASTTLLIEKYKPKAVINQGTAGGHDPNIHVFDTVIGTEVINIGSFRSERMEDGQGMKPEKWIHMSTELRDKNGEKQDYASLPSDPKLVEVAKSVADQYKHGKVVEGVIGSGDWWNREIDRIQWFHENFGTSGEEMEAFAVAQVAHLLDVPYLSLRTISNSEVTDDNIEDLDKAGHYGAEFTIDVVKAIAN